MKDCWVPVYMFSKKCFLLYKFSILSILCIFKNKINCESSICFSYYKKIVFKKGKKRKAFSYFFYKINKYLWFCTTIFGIYLNMIF